MSRLSELMSELCPDGVEYKRLGDITNYEQPAKYIVNSVDYRDEYLTPVLTAGQTFILSYTDETDGIYSASRENPVIIFDDFTGSFQWVDFPFKVKSSAMKILKANEDVVFLRYLFHVMGCIKFSTKEHRRIWIRVYSGFRVPIPPLDLQAEVVRILDSFTEYTAMLSRELELRKLQYTHYRDKLLYFTEKP